jgi:DNA invertase Pin-like site-specific DNA recombinase
MQTTLRAAVYIRVSTASKSKNRETIHFIQNPEIQEQPLLDLVVQRGWMLHQVYSDRASGAKERRQGLMRSLPMLDVVCSK